MSALATSLSSRAAVAAPVRGRKASVRCTAAKPMVVSAKLECVPPDAHAGTHARQPGLFRAWRRVRSDSGAVR